MRFKATVLVAVLVFAVAMVVSGARESMADSVNQEQVGGRTELDRGPGPGPFTPVFLIVYLRKDGNWGKDDCITVFPETAKVSLTKKPKKVLWVVLEKDEYHQWEVIPKTGGDDRVPPLQKRIGKGNNAFWSGPPSSQGVPYTWDYSIKLTELDGDGNPTGNQCEKDPGVEVRG